MDIRIEHLSKAYGGRAAVDDISFDVHTGEVLGLLGPNGAGKTTTMRMVLGLLPPDAGTIRIGGVDVATAGKDLRRSIGYLPESNPLHEDMPVLDLLRFAARIQGVPAGKVEARLRDMVDACGLGAEKHKRVGELSKGYRQRVGLAQALVHAPQVLILDEPTSGLDPNQLLEIRALIQELGKACTVIFSTHILSEVEATCDRVVIIGRGRIVADATPAALHARVMGQAVLRARIEGASPAAISAALQGIPGIVRVVASEDDPRQYELHGPDVDAMARAVFVTCVREGAVLVRLEEAGTRLEDVFRDLTLPSPAP